MAKWWKFGLGKGKVREEGGRVEVLRSWSAP